MPYATSFLCCLLNGGSVMHSFYDEDGNLLYEEDVYWEPVCPGSFRLSQDVEKKGRRGVYKCSLQNIRLAEIYKLLSVYKYFYTTDENCAFSKVFCKQVN